MADRVAPEDRLGVVVNPALPDAPPGADRDLAAALAAGNQRASAQATSLVAKLGKTFDPYERPGFVLSAGVGFGYPWPF